MKYKYLGAFLAFSITAGAFFASSSEASFFRSKKTQDRADAPQIEPQPADQKASKKPFWRSQETQKRINDRKGADMPAGLDGRCNPTCIKDICSSRFPQDSLVDALAWCKQNCSASREDSKTGTMTALPLVSHESYPANVCKNLAPLPSSTHFKPNGASPEFARSLTVSSKYPESSYNDSSELTVSESYRILGLPEGTDAASVKNAYYKLARQYHPDKNPDKPEAEEKFKKINAANEFLQNYFEKQATENFLKKPFSCEETCLKDICSPLYAQEEEELYNLKITCVQKCTNSKNPATRALVRDRKYPANICSNLTPAPHEFRPRQLNEDEIQQAGAPFSPATNEGLPNLPYRRSDSMNAPDRQQRNAPLLIDEGLKGPSLPTEPSPTYQPGDSAAPVGNRSRSYGFRSQRESAPTQRFNDAPPPFPTTPEGRDALRMRPDLSYHQDYKEGPEPYIPSSPPPTTHFEGRSAKAPSPYPTTREGRDALEIPQRFKEAPPRYPTTREGRNALRMRPDLSYHQDYKEGPEPYIPSSPSSDPLKGSSGEAPPRYPTTREGRDALEIPQRFNDEYYSSVPGAAPNTPPHQRRQSRIENYGAPNLDSPYEQGDSGEAPYSNTPTPFRPLPPIPSRQSPAGAADPSSQSVREKRG